MGIKRTILQGHEAGSKWMWAKLMFIWRLFSNRVWMPPRIDSVFELLTNVVLQLKPCPSGLKLRRHGSRSFVLSQPFSVCNSLCLWGNWFNATFLASFLPIIARAKAALLVRLSFTMLASKILASAQVICHQFLLDVRIGWFRPVVLRFTTESLHLHQWLFV